MKFLIPLSRTTSLAWRATCGPRLPSTRPPPNHTRSVAAQRSQCFGLAAAAFYGGADRQAVAALLLQAVVDGLA